MKFIFIYAVLVLVVLLVLYIKHRLTRMPIGRAWKRCVKIKYAISMGLNHVLVKLSAFTRRCVKRRGSPGCSSSAIRLCEPDFILPSLNRR
jgi:hypothetical protein